MDERQSGNDQSRRPADNRNNSTLVWFALIIVVALAIAMFLLLNQTQKTIRYGDFADLLDATQYVKENGRTLAPGFSGKIVIKEAGADGREIEYSKPNDISVDDRTISGSVEYKVLTGTGADVEGKRVKFIVNKAHSDQVDADLEKELSRTNMKWGFSAGPGIFEKYGYLFITLGLIVLLFLFMVRRLGGAGGPMQFGRSRGRLYAEEDLGVTFNDVAGIDEAVEEVKEVVDFLKVPEKYQKLGGRIPRGVLLVGPPGTGKTLLAKAIAGEAGVPFFSLSGSDFVEMFVGVGAARVRDMFQQAETKAPCIIFIDELDALGKTRSGSVVGGHDEREQTLNALLVEMDGFASNSGVIVMAATNRPETLDQALMRPGRFDRHVLVDRPDVRGREEILKVHVKNVKLDPNVILKQVASISPGFVGADLANLVNEAALLAARKEKSTVGMDEFNDGVERVTAGLEKKKRIMNQDEKQRVAYMRVDTPWLPIACPIRTPFTRSRSSPGDWGHWAIPCSALRANDT